MSRGERGSREARAAAIERAVAAIGPPGAGVGDVARSALAAWIEGVVDWNARIDLTAARSDDELVDLMIADALILARHVPRGARFVDVGSGAGAPGLALAIVRSDLEGVLVEPLDKRVAFLRRSIGALASHLGSRVTVVRGRGEPLVAQGRTFDVAISRATLPPPEWLALGVDLAPRGEVWVLLAQGESPEIQGWRVADDLPYAWPLTGASRRALRFVPAEAAT